MAGAIHKVAEQKIEGPLDDIEEPLEVELDPIDHLVDPFPEGNFPLIKNLVVEDSGRLRLGQQTHRNTSLSNPSMRFSTRPISSMM